MCVCVLCVHVCLCVGQPSLFIQVKHTSIHTKTFSFTTKFYFCLDICKDNSIPLDGCPILAKRGRNLTKTLFKKGGGGGWGHPKWTLDLLHKGPP